MSATNILQLIGNTPMLELRRLDTGPCRLFAKLEFQNPGGSVKDRIGLSMIEAAEREGKIKPGDTIIEATAGNTGLSLALVAVQKGYRMLVVLPDKMSQEKVAHIKALGAEVIITRSDVAKGHPEYYQDVAKRIAGERADAFYIDQFSNPANPRAHEEGTAAEIWEQREQMEHDVDAFVCGVGTGGTLTGIGRYFERVAPHVEMVLADPEGSVLADYCRNGEMHTPGAWLVEGIGEDFIPPVCDLDLVTEPITVSDAEAFQTARELLRKEGIFGGSSSGTLVTAALKYCRRQTEPKRVVTLIPDSGNKYLSKMYNDYWMLDKGFIQRKSFGDLRDLIARRHVDHATITVGPDEPLLNAYTRMSLYSIAQLPVMDNGRIIGIVDESDILLAVYNHEDYFQHPVREAMTSKMEIIKPSSALKALLLIFNQGFVAIVMDGSQFLGLITKIDLLNFLRRRFQQSV